MAYQLSPGVESQEIDLTTIAPGVATTEAAYVGRYNWGPVNEVVQIEDEVEEERVFGKPDSNTYLHFFGAADFLAYGRNLKLVRATSNSNTAVSNNAVTPIRIPNETYYETNYYDGSGNVGTWAARYPGALGNSLLVSTCPSAAAFSGTHSLTGNVTTGSANVTINGALASDTGRTISVGDYINVGGTGDKIVSGISGNTIIANSAFSSNLTLQTIVSSWRYADEFNGAPGTTVFTASKSGANDEMHVIVIDNYGKFSGASGTILEKYPYVSKAFDAKNEDGTTNYYRDVIKEKSEYIWWMDHLSGGTNWGNAAQSLTFTDVRQVEYANLSLGTDAAPSTADIVNGYAKFRNAEEHDISLVIGGSHNSTIVSYIIDNIIEHRKDCVGFFSPEQADVVNNVGNEQTDVLSYRNGLTSTSYGFMDSGWKYRFDRFNNVYRWVPLSADIAGLVAQADFNGDPWVSPAGLTKGRVKNCVKLAWSPNQSERDELYKKGVNPVVTFPGEGTVLYGDKTMLVKPSAFDRINVRRLFIVLRKSISKAARYSLFEINDRFTRSQFVALVEPFLRDVKGRRGLTDYRIVCDESNNTPAVIQRNEFVADIYIKPAYSINYIKLNFIAVNLGVTFDEAVGSRNNF